jgi:hypothetical protein
VSATAAPPDSDELLSVMLQGIMSLSAMDSEHVIDGSHIGSVALFLFSEWYALWGLVRVQWDMPCVSAHAMLAFTGSNCSGVWQAQVSFAVQYKVVIFPRLALQCGWLAAEFCAWCADVAGSMLACLGWQWCFLCLLNSVND